MDEIRIPWPGWKEIRKIGKGGNGKVYEITRTDKFGVEERAAMKVLRFPQDETDNKILLAEGYEKNTVLRHIIGSGSRTLESEAIVKLPLLSILISLTVSL